MASSRKAPGGTPGDLFDWQSGDNQQLMAARIGRAIPIRPTTRYPLTIRQQDFMGIRSWEGSQHRAFEELCYQLRDLTPRGASSHKLGNPDGGYEWFVRHRNGVEWGWQAKFSDDVESLLKMMETSLRTVVSKRPNCRRLTFCIPIDLPGGVDPGRKKSAWQKFEDRKRSWKERIPGAECVRIDLWQAGDLLQRLALPQHRGRAWFFWDEEVFGPDWCRARLEVTTVAAGERYMPQLNVELPVAFALEGLGRSDPFAAGYRRRRGEMLKAARRVTEGRFLGLGVTPQLRALGRHMADCAALWPADPLSQGTFARQEMLEAVRATERLAWEVYPERTSKRGQQSSGRSGSLRHYAGSLSGRAEEFAEFLTSPAAEAAEHGGLLMLGDAGQGKTHLFCDAGARALESGRPCVVLLGQQFTGSRVFTDLAERLALPPRGAAELLGAMAAAGEATGKPFVLLIDALNDSGDPRGWQTELPALLAEVAQHAPWIAVGLSVRSTYAELVASHATEALPEVTHPGFDGFEIDAAARYFAVYGLDLPDIPLLLPEFSNPLFLRMYCEAMAAFDASTPTAGHAHISGVFDWYLAAKNKAISDALALDPRRQVVQKAVDAFALAVAGEPREWLEREQARALIDSYAPHLHQWPNTLFGRLLAEGVLTEDTSYQESDTGGWELVAGVQITFQRFADYRIASSLLAPYADAAALRKALAGKSALRRRLLETRAGVIAALCVLVPERYGIELLDAATWNLDETVAPAWYRTTLTSMAARREDAASDRTVELLKELSGKSGQLFVLATEVLITVAARPGHLLNADFLHRSLMSRSMPDRDAGWGRVTYYWLDSQGPLDRLLRWAAQPRERTTEEVIELSCVPLVWTFSSPNRTLRDYTTKTVCHLLSGRLAVVEALLQRFRGVNDPYVLQRLAVVAHGSVLVGGPADPEAALSCARLLSEIVLDPQTLPDVLLRDAARGAMEWCLRAKLVDADEYELVKPPYGADPPAKPRTEKQLEKAYDRFTGEPDDPGYSSLFVSIFGLGDFGNYVIGSKVRRFSRYRLDKPMPPKRAPRRLPPDEAKLAELERDFTEEQRAWLSARDWDALMESLSWLERMQLSQAVAPTAKPVSRDYPHGLAQRWIFERVISLGWTPQRFGRFDRNYQRSFRAGRSGHKPERFGKKYQWIALYELLARIADNFHMADEWEGDPKTYDGPWRTSTRDIDPTLPPAPRLRDEDGVEYFGPTHPPDSEGDWWIPPGPTYSGEDPPAVTGWAEDPSDIPTLRQVIIATDQPGDEWVVLHAYYSWDEKPTEDQERDERSRRDMWSHIYSWLVRPQDATAMFSYLSKRTLMNQWTPHALEITDAAYVPEMPWAEAAREYPQQWEDVQARDGKPGSGVCAYATWEEYYWEGNVWDCSIEDGVRVMVPAQEIFEAAGLAWVPGTRSWADGSGVVAEYHETDQERRSVLLVRRSWLDRVLVENDWALVVGWLGEKQLLGSGIHGGLLGGWTEINGVAVLKDGAWKFGQRRLKLRYPAH